ncbi:MAG: hypothetical protein JSW11_13780 [Candidatus Heimdallarchaeota archaeon]|nr:MAG: hypothetical protein JSW11_13780 [Candidatus Heimdallarchaeota archaeon]
MDIKHALNEAKTLIIEKKAEQAAELLNNAYNILQSQPPDDLTQEEKILLEGEIQESLGDTKILQQQDQEALSHLLMAMTQLQTLETMIDKPPHEVLFRVYRKLSGAFNRLGQQFESEKYLRNAGEIKAAILKTELHTRFREAGYKVQENVRAVETEASPVDVMAEKGGFFSKKRVAIWFAMDEAELDTIAFLTRGYAKYAKERYVLMLMGESTIPSLQGATIISSIDQIKM